MRKIAFLVAAFIIILLFVPFLFVSLAPKPASSKPAESSGSASDASAEPIKTITTYVTSEDKVIEMDFTEYLKGVVAAEMPASFGDEALKAQAVAARSYILTRIKGYERDGTPPEHKGALTCTDPNHCKAWLSQEQLIARWGQDWMTNYWPKISADVEATKGVIMTYNGDPVNAVFHSTSSGHTENSKDVWGGDIPYLVSVSSPGDETSPKYNSSVTLSTQEYKEKILTLKPEAVWEDGKPLVESFEKSDAGGVTSVLTGGIRIKGTEFRTLFGLQSTHIEFEEKDEQIIMNMKGNGHGVGMSQYGANYLASQGMGYVDILKTYYTGVEVK